MLGQVIEFIRDPQNSFAAHTWTTLLYSIIPTVLAVLIAVPLGVLVARRPLAAFLAANTSGLMRAVPTLAFLTLAVQLSFLGFGLRPIVTGLTVLGIPPILLNTIAGLRGVDPAAVEAGRGMGMTPWQVLRRIQVPLVLPVVMAGVRTAAVQIVATTPIAALVGGGGYGEYISDYLTLLEVPPLIVGVAGVALLALIVEFGLAGVQRAVTPAGLRTGAPGVAPTRATPAEEPEAEPRAA